MDRIIIVKKRGNTMRKPKQRDFYREIDIALKSYEDYKPWHDKSIDWICNRIE